MFYHTLVHINRNSESSPFCPNTQAFSLGLRKVPIALLDLHTLGKLFNSALHSEYSRPMAAMKTMNTLYHDYHYHEGREGLNKVGFYHLYSSSVRLALKCQIVCELTSHLIVRESILSKAILTCEPQSKITGYAGRNCEMFIVDFERGIL